MKILKKYYFYVKIKALLIINFPSMSETIGKRISRKTKTEARQIYITKDNRQVFSTR